MKTHYSGARSKAFWNRVHRLPPESFDAVYAIGCVLQDVESRVFWALTFAENNIRKAKTAKRKARQLVGSK